jgi:hypothetical protein
MTTSEIVTNQVGLLTLRSRTKNGLIKAQCQCGFPSVIVDEEDWIAGVVLGCSSCHTPELERQQKEARELQRQQEIDERVAKREARDRELWFEPNYGELSAPLKKLFKRLSSGGSFGVDTVAEMAKVSREYAWDHIVSEMLQANCLIETQMVGYQYVTRPYSLDGPYAAGAKRESKYTCRTGAVRQLREAEAQSLIEAEKQPEPVAEPRPEVTYASDDVFGGDVKSFIDARCICGPGEAESEIVLRAKFVAYMESIKQPAMLPAEFLDTLGRLKYEVSNGKVRGLRLKKMSEL